MEIQTITSTQNDLVKYCAKLQMPKFRMREKMILIDGEKTIQGLICDGFEFEALFIEQTYFENLKDKGGINIEKIKAKKLIKAPAAVLKKISTTASYSKLAGIIKEPLVEVEKFKNLNKIALIDGIKDAGNLGTIIRSAVAFSFNGIILFNDCVDLYNAKVIRASAQNMFKIPIFKTKNIEFIKKLKNSHALISTVVDSKRDFVNYNFNKNFILALGSEANGISREILNLSDEHLTIKMDNQVESINLAVCASIAFALIKFN